MAQAFANGLNTKISGSIGRTLQSVNNVSASSSNAVDSVANSVSSLNDTVNGVSNVSPMVTPIMDLSNIQNGANSISSMFGDTVVGVGGIRGNLLGGGINELSNMLGSMTATSDNTNVVDAIHELQMGMAEMVTAIGRMQVRMDSGALVGQIAGTMDSALGRRARLKERTG